MLQSETQRKYACFASMLGPLSPLANSALRGRLPNTGKNQRQVPVLCDVHTEPPVKATTFCPALAGWAALMVTAEQSNASVIQQNVTDFIKPPNECQEW